MWFHLHKEIIQAKLICGERNETVGSFGKSRGGSFKGTKGTFQGNENDLHLDKGVGYSDIQIHQNWLNCSFKSYEFHM